MQNVNFIYKQLFDFMILSLESDFLKLFFSFEPESWD